MQEQARSDDATSENLQLDTKKPLPKPVSVGILVKYFMHAWFTIRKGKNIYGWNIC